MKNLKFFMILILLTTLLSISVSAISATNLISPINDTFSQNRNPLFNWNYSSGNISHYVLEIANETDFNASNMVFNISFKVATYFQAEVTNRTYYYLNYTSNLTADSRHYWRIVAWEENRTHANYTYFEYETDNTNPTNLELRINGTDNITTADAIINFSYSYAEKNLDTIKIGEIFIKINNSANFTTNYTHTICPYCAKTCSYNLSMIATDKAGNTANHSMILTAYPCFINSTNREITTAQFMNNSYAKWYFNASAKVQGVEDITWYYFPMAFYNSTNSSNASWSCDFKITYPSHYVIYNDTNVNTDNPKHRCKVKITNKPNNRYRLIFLKYSIMLKHNKPLTPSNLPNALTVFGLSAMLVVYTISKIYKREGW